MASGVRQRTAGGDHLVWFLCFLAGATQIALIAVFIDILTSPTNLHNSLDGIAWAASIVHILAVLVLPIMVLISLRRAASCTQTILSAGSVLLATLAVLLSIYVLTQIWNNINGISSQVTVRETVRGLVMAGFVVWSITIVAQAILYMMLLWPTTTPKDTELSTEASTSRSSPARSTKRSFSLQLSVLSPPPTPLFARSANASPASTHRSSPRSSTQYSMDNVIRPMTSKTRLLIRKARDSYSLHAERRASPDTSGQEDDDFGDWDTSGPDDIPQDFQMQRQARTRLETIPGSRPVSPAKPLDGPFQEADEDEAEAERQQYYEQQTETYADYFPPSTIQPATATSPSSETSSIIRFSTSTSPQGPTTPVESHIHPLFRSESPVPPPSKSATTTIYASPHAGQVVSPDGILGSRVLYSANGHRAESPQPLSPLSPPRSRQGSFQSQRWPVPQAVGGEPRPSRSFVRSPGLEG